MHLSGSIVTFFFIYTEHLAKGLAAIRGVICIDLCQMRSHFRFLLCLNTTHAVCWPFVFTACCGSHSVLKSLNIYTGSVFVFYLTGRTRVCRDAGLQRVEWARCKFKPSFLQVLAGNYCAKCSFDLACMCVLASH